MLYRRVPFYWLLSYWILALSLLYPVLHVNTFPLNVLALAGVLEFVAKPFEQNLTVAVLILAVHLAPFLWIPYDLSPATVAFGLQFSLMYVFVMEFVLDKSVVDVYLSVLREKSHSSLVRFLAVRGFTR